jgi:hypothetical protein
MIRGLVLLALLVPALAIRAYRPAAARVAHEPELVDELTGGNAVLQAD